MLRIRIVEQIDDIIDKVKPLLYQSYPNFSEVDGAILKHDQKQKIIRMEQISFLMSLQNASKYYVLAEEDGILVGFATLNSLAVTHFYSMSWVCVEESYRGRGIGKLITRESVAFCRRHNNEVVLTTEIPDFYKKLGFEISNEFKQGWYLMATSGMKENK